MDKTTFILKPKADEGMCSNCVHASPQSEKDKRGAGVGASYIQYIFNAIYTMTDRTVNNVSQPVGYLRIVRVS